MLKKGLEGELPDTSDLLKGQGASKESATKDLEEKAGGLLKSLPFGK